VSKPWSRNAKKAQKRADVERSLKFLEGKNGDPLICFYPKCGKPALGMDECLTCIAQGKEMKILSCAKHRQAGLSAVKKHALVKHPSNLLRVIAAGLAGEEI
jgi:hypothetical protein